MALRVSGFVARHRLGSMPDATDRAASNYYLELSPEYLSAYDLGDRDTLEGEIVEVGDERGRSVDDLLGSEVSFVVVDSFPDRLYLSTASFEELREWGFVAEGFWLSVELTHAVSADGRFAVYTKRDIEV